MPRQRIIHASAALALAACLAATAGCSSESKTDGAASSPSAGQVTATAAADAHNPYALLPKVPSFTVTSATVKDGQPLPQDEFSGIFKVPGGKDISPQLTWSGFPSQTKSFVVWMYDPEGPTPSGFWHWYVADIPVTTTSLAAGAGVPASAALPAGAFQINNDAGVPRYVGAAPPAGSGTHRHFITVTALDEPKTGVPATTSPALFSFYIGAHTIGRATLVSPVSAS
jgi:Raf kinase inhibitor-like YbhB/YbcL family protein